MFSGEGLKVESADGEGTAISGKGVRNRVRLPRDMLDCAIIFCDRREMALLSLGDWIGLLGNGVHEWHVICEDVEVDAFEEVAKMADGSMHSEELPVEGAVVLLYGGQLAAEESDGCRPFWGDLL